MRNTHLAASAIHRLLQASVLASILAAASVASADDDVMLQGFYWDAPNGWYGTLQKQEPELEKAGFTAMWLPPPSKGMSGASSNGYDPYDHYDLGEFEQKGSVATRWGTKQDLLDLIAKLHKGHMKAYADIVMNHMMGADAQETCPKNGQTDWTRFDYNHAAPDGAPSWATVESRLGRTIPHGAEPYLFKKTWMDFHPNDEHADNNAPYHDKAFGPDLCQKHDWVNVGLKLWGDWLVDSIGYDGFRVDYAKGLDEGYLNEWFHDGKKNGKFAVMEVWDNIDTIAWYVNQTGASAFDFPLFYTLKDMCNDTSGGFDMRKLDGAGFAARDSMHAVTFAENHDTDRSSPIVNNKMMAYAFILSLEGYPCVFYKDYSTYGLKAQIDPLIKIRKKLAGGTTTTLYRDQHLFVAQRNGYGSLPGLVLVLNNDPGNWQGQWVTVKSDWAGKDLKDYTGQAQTQHVADDRRVQLWAPPHGYAIYSIDGVDLGLSAPETPASTSPDASATAGSPAAPPGGSKGTGSSGPSSSATDGPTSSATPRKATRRHSTTHRPRR
ncbi:DUF1939 domain-containing protein [bacterium]|nr:DUF1939 domain-containing protein [bacterium]